MAVNARTEEFQHIEVFDKPALFTNGRIARDTVPKGWYCYDIRGSDDDPGALCYMEENVVVNHAGSVLMPEKLAMPKSGRLNVRDELGFLDEGDMTLREFCEAHQLPYPAENMKFHIRPARPEEAGLFYTPHPEEDKRLGTVGHVRMDFGRSGNEFWHTWWPRGPEELNSPVFKAELQEVVDTLRGGCAEKPLCHGAFLLWATGDCHGNFERFRPEYFPEQAQMTKDDVVVVTGDFGGIWFGDARDDEALGCLESLPFTLAFVDGNHENYDALASYPAEKWQGGKIHRIRPHVLHLMRGQIYELEGYRFFTMGGAKSHDIEDGILDPDDPNFGRKFLMLQRRPRSRYRINHISWWAQELPSDEEYDQARRSLDAAGWQVDYIITHCAPTSIALAGTRHNEADRLTDFLQEVRERAKYHYWLFGHYHDNRAIDEKHILLWEQIVRVI